MSAPQIDTVTFHTDVQYIESLWQSATGSGIGLPLIDIGRQTSHPLVFLPILEHLEFVYARQIRVFSQTRRVIMYRRRETRTRPVGLAERAEELRQVLDALGLEHVDLVGHGDAAMVLLEFAARCPDRCRSLVIVAQAADYQIAPHPLIWLLHDLFLRLPVEHILPSWFLRRMVVNYILARKAVRLTTLPASDPSLLPDGSSLPPGDGTAQPPVCSLPRSLIDEQFRKIVRWPFVYKYSVLPIIHSFDMRERLSSLTMPILLINRTDDALSPAWKTRQLAEELPNCFGHCVIPGGERFFMYAQAEAVNAVMEQFYSRIQEG